MTSENKQQIEVFFDGSCPLCTREINLYKNTPTSCSISYSDVSSMESSEEKNKLMKRFHIKDQQGNMLSGAKAFVELWKQMKGWKYLAKPFDNKIGLSILEFFYVQFLKIRPIFQKAFKIIDKH
jgi:predicted DCC family thiol-disulfide oxidoreductase YuxK